MKPMTTVIACAAVGLAACEKKVDVGPIRPGHGTITVLETGGPDGDTGWWPSLVFDVRDRPHLSFCDAYNGDLRYATKVDGKWAVENVIEKGAVGKYTAIAVDSLGTVGIAFYDQDIKYLRYAYRVAGSSRQMKTAKSSSEALEDEGAGGWKTEKIAWGLEVGMGSKLLFDDEDTAHLFYYTPSAKLIHATKRRGGAWEKNLLAKSTGSWSARIDARARTHGPWVSYVDWTFKDTTLYLARPKLSHDAESWSIETVATRHGPGWQSQLVFDDDQPSVLYTVSLKRELRIAQRGDDRWESKILLHDAATFAASQHQDGDLVVAYEDIKNGSPGRGVVRYLRRNAGKWSRVAVDPEGPAGSHVAVALDRRGNPMIAYYAGDIRGLKIYDETD